MAGNTVATPFEYRVVISHEDLEEDIVSELQEVKVVNYATTVVAITDVELLFNTDVALTSGKVALGDSVNVNAVKGTLKDGKVDQTLSGMTYKSSNPAVAVVNSTGVITPLSAGKVDITVKVGTVEKVVSLEVVSEAREATAVTVSKDVVKLVTGGAKATVDVEVKDQYGDAMKNFEVAASSAAVENEDEDSIATTSSTAAKTDKEGKATIEFTSDSVNAGEGVFEIGDKLASINVIVEDASEAEVAKRIIEITSDSKSDDYELDLYTTVEDDSELKVVWNEYTANDTLIGAVTDYSSKYTLASSKTSVATVSNVSGVITVTPVAVGTTTITIKEGSITRASFQVTVVDTTPVATSIALADKVTEIELSKTTGEYVFTDIEDNFVVLDQFGEEMALADADVEFFTDNETVVVVTDTAGDGSGDPAIDVSSATVGKTATLIVSIGAGKVVSVTVKIVA